jgi:hypothetical protein
MDEGSGFPVAMADSAVKPATAANGLRPTFVTMATRDSAAQSRVFARSVHANQPDARLAVLVLDAPPAQGFADLFDLVVPADQLPLEVPQRASLDALCCSLKPLIIRHVLDVFADSPVLYFDNDIELFTPLSEVEAALARGADLILTPHVLHPDADQARERELLRMGRFNEGFVAVAPSRPARAFVSWWCDRAGGKVPSRGEKWLDLAPSICGGVTVMQHPGYNFAYWNAHERPLGRRDGLWTAAGAPLRFLHYHQWDLRAQNWEQYLLQRIGGHYHPFAELFSAYQQKVLAERPAAEELSSVVQRQLLMPSGEVVPDLVRDVYLRHCPEDRGAASEISAQAIAVLNAASRDRANLPDLPITVLYDEIWQRHAGLRQRFDVDEAAGRSAYLRWLVELGATELEIPSAFIAPARRTLDAERVRQLEAGGEQDRPSAPLGVSAAPEPATSVEAAILIAARDAERDRVRRQERDIQLLVSSNKGLRREVLSLQVRNWRDEERIAGLERDLAQTRDALAAAIRRGRRLAREVERRLARLRSWAAASLGGSMAPALPVRPHRELLAGDEPFFQRGFCLGEGVAIIGTAIRKLKRAPPGIMVFGPYLNLPAGNYAVVIEARLYQRLPLSAGFTVEIAYGGGHQIIASRRFRLLSTNRSRRFSLPFTVWDGEDCPDLEIRIWGRRRAPLEIGGISMFELLESGDSALSG